MEYEPGTVAVATVRGVPNVRVFRRGQDWVSARLVEGWFTHFDSCVTDIRPGIVLDHSHIDDATAALDAILAAFDFYDEDERHAIKELRNQIEAQAKPLHIEEPKGIGAVAETDGGVLYVRDPAGFWRSEDECRFWSDLNVLRVLSPGIEN